MNIFSPDPSEQAERIEAMHAVIFDADTELLAASDNPTIQHVKSDQRARALINRRLDALEGAALAGELDADQVQTLRKLQARARLLGLRRRYI